jgi:hypothetical protein
MEAPRVGFAGDDDVAPVSRAIVCRIHICRHIGLRGFFGLFEGLGLAAPSELHLLNHARRTLRWQSVGVHLDGFFFKGSLAFNADCDTLQGFATQEHRRVDLAIGTRSSLSR